MFTYNAALNRPVYESSTYRDRFGDYVGSLANDGNHETHISHDDKPTCFTTHHETNPWWAVDLTRALRIYSVDLTNRDHDGKLINKI